MTYTYAILEISPAAYREIREKLEAAGYQHAFEPDGAIDMHGIALAEKAIGGNSEARDQSAPDAIENETGKGI